MPKYRSLAVVKARLRLYTDYERKRSWDYYSGDESFKGRIYEDKIPPVPKSLNRVVTKQRIALDISRRKQSL